MLGAFQGNLDPLLALLTLETEHNLLGGLGLLSKNRLRLSTETLLLSIVPTSTLSELGLLRLLVLSHLELLMVPTLIIRTVRPTGLRNIHLKKRIKTLKLLTQLKAVQCIDGIRQKIFFNPLQLVPLKRIQSYPHIVNLIHEEFPLQIFYLLPKMYGKHERH